MNCDEFTLITKLIKILIISIIWPPQFFGISAGFRRGRGPGGGPVVCVRVCVHCGQCKAVPVGLTHEASDSVAGLAAISMSSYPGTMTIDITRPG